jgi:hypothetical protein
VQVELWAAARLTKLSMTGATHTVPPTTAPALMTPRREIRDVPISSMMDSSVTNAPFRPKLVHARRSQVGR